MTDLFRALKIEKVDDKQTINLVDISEKSSLKQAINEVVKLKNVGPKSRAGITKSD